MLMQQQQPIPVVQRYSRHNLISKKLARFGEGAPRSDCPTVPCTTPETVYDHATPRHPYNLHLHLALYYATPAPCR